MVQATERPTAVNEIASTQASVPTFQLQPRTEAGQHLVAIAEQHAADFATRAGEHDRDGTYPFENIEALKQSGYLYAPIPVELGGLGVESYHDVLVASSRLAQGDPSLTIGVNMHLAAVGNLSQRYRQAKADGNERRITAFGTMLAGLARGGQVLAAAVSEASQDLTRPATRAERTEAGWRINGTKIFATMSPAATAFYVATTHVNEDGEERYAYAIVPVDTLGVTINNDWDALGMRASGSHSVTFKDVDVPESAIRGGWPAGHLTPDFLEINMTPGLYHASASLGIAESAHATVLEAVTKKLAGGPPSAHTLITSSQNAIDLYAARSAFGRGAELVDQFFQTSRPDEWTLEFVASYAAQVQSAKAFINEAAVRIVDRALALSGGAGYMNKHSLSRAYRDVRAGAFMHPLGSNRAGEFIGQVTLGLKPTLS